MKDAGTEMRLIGQFGGGFYSAFMVAKRVIVRSRSAMKDAKGQRWESDGSGSFTVTPAEGVERGTMITVELKDDNADFCKSDKIKDLIKRYSNFVPFPIFVNGERVNTVEAIWTKQKGEIKDEAYTEFYKFIANAYDEPSLRLHFTADAPIDIKALLFVPKSNFEKFGFGRQEPGVSLYCRNVLIDPKNREILPEWMRFVKGVIDSEDLPLNISRETMQDKSLMAKIRKIIVKRFIKFLSEEAGKSEEKYQEFFAEFGVFLKEGLSVDHEYREDIAKLLRLESSKTENGKLTSLEEYIKRAPETQKEIYFINGPSRETIEAGPYLEAFRAKDMEVLFTFEVMDDFVLGNLSEFLGKKIVSAENAEIEMDQKEGEKLTSDQSDQLCKWIKEILGETVSEVRVSKRLAENPAIVISKDSHFSNSVQRMMKNIHKDFPGMEGSYILELNPAHELIRNLSALKEANPDLAKLIAQQIYDNTRVLGGLTVEPRPMVERMNRIMSAMAGSLQK
ncbi:MAG: molecular chaperone HtpG [Candidatus Wallbacteria bacterium]|nr:molecular chaperone HtpG [Candidatus Wallbacteria bacterium]